MSVSAPKRRRKQGRERDRLWIDVPFVKALPEAEDGSGDLILTGYANTWGMDRDDEMVATDAFDSSLPDFLAKNPMVLWQHNSDWPIGMVLEATTDATGLFVRVRVPNPGDTAADYQRAAYTAIKNGIVRTFSIGGYMYRDVKMGPDGPVFIIVEVELFEISCVSIPANADSIYEAAVKALAGEPARMSEKATSQMEQLLGFTLLSDPELLAMSEDAKGERYRMLAHLFEASHGAEAPGYEAWRKVDAARKAGVSPLKVAAATSMLAKQFYMPASDEKAGRAISAANQRKLEGALEAHDEMEAHCIDMAESMKAFAKAHGESMQALKDVLGVEDEEEPEPEGNEGADDTDEGDKSAPESDEKQLQSNITTRLRELGTERFGVSGTMGQNVYVYIDDVDMDEGFVIYCLYGPETESYQRVSFMRGADGSISLADEATEVVPSVDYVPKGLEAPADLKQIREQLKAADSVEEPEEPEPEPAEAKP